MPHQKTSCKLIASVLCVSFTHISHMFNSHSFKKILNSLFYSIFQRHGEKNLKTDLDSQGNILQGDSDYYDLPCDLETQTLIFRLLLLFGQRPQRADVL